MVLKMICSKVVYIIFNLHMEVMIEMFAIENNIL